jgi:hypothetical protein
MTLMAAGFGLMALLYLVFSKVVPMIAIWELKVGMQEAHAGAGTGEAAVVHAASGKSVIGDVSP